MTPLNGKRHLDSNDDEDQEILRQEIYGKDAISFWNAWLDIIRNIWDPEEPGTLEELKMVS